MVQAVEYAVIHTIIEGYISFENFLTSTREQVYVFRQDYSYEKEISLWPETTGAMRTEEERNNVWVHEFKRP